MSVLLIAEHNNKNLKPFTLNAISAASKIDAEVHVLVAGSGSESVAKEVAAVPLVKKVLHCDSPNYQNYLPENLAPLVTKHSEKYDHIVASANTFGKNFMPRVAAALDTSQVSDIIKVNSPDTFVRPIYAGNAFATFSDPLPATKTCTSASILDAAVIAFKVNGLRFLLLCSAINSTDIKLPLPRF